jgi:hypothetical protein
MKSMNLAAFSLFFLSASARFFQQLSGPGVQQPLGEQEVKPFCNNVPGDSPLCFCDDPSGDILKIKDISLSPNPPVPGQKLFIKALGDLRSTVCGPIIVRLTVQYGYITIFNKPLDMCDYKDEIEPGMEKCEFKPKLYNITKTADIPKQIPPGVYTVTANAETEAGKTITCLTAKVQMG